MNTRANHACTSHGGVPKRAFSTREEAAIEAAKHTGYKPYRCIEHGWHVGSVLSRALRAAIGWKK
jgi:hypothetical protein